MAYVYSKRYAFLWLAVFMRLFKTKSAGLLSSSACPSASICGSFPLAVTETEGQK